MISFYFLGKYNIHRLSKGKYIDTYYIISIQPECEDSWIYIGSMFFKSYNKLNRCALRKLVKIKTRENRLCTLRPYRIFKRMSSF